MTHVLIKIRDQNADTQRKKEDHEKTEADDGYLRAKERGHRINQFC